MTYYTSPIKHVKGRTPHDILHKLLMRRTARFQQFTCYSKFTHSCLVSELQEGKRERQVMLPIVLLIKFVLLFIIFQVSYSFHLLVTNWRLLPEFWSPNIFSTRHGDQNGHSVERCNSASCVSESMFNNLKEFHSISVLISLILFHLSKKQNRN